MIDLGDIFDKVNEDLSGAESTRFRNMLKKDIVNFRYRKKDNSVRRAKGTLKKDMLPRYRQEKRAKSDPKRFIYWDVEKGSFRSFLRANFIKIDGVEKKGAGKGEQAENASDAE